MRGATDATTAADRCDDFVELRCRRLCDDDGQLARRGGPGLLSIPQLRLGLAETLPLSDPRLVADPFFNDHMQGAVEKALARRGIRLTDGEPPDLWIHYHANIRRRIQPLDWASGYDAAFDSAPGVANVEESTFVLDFIDARTNRLIWRGWAQRWLGNLLENRDRLAATIDEAVRRMLLHFPPAL